MPDLTKEAAGCSLRGNNQRRGDHALTVRRKSPEDKRPSHWDRYNAIRESSLSIRAKWIAWVICCYAGDAGDCFASVETLAADCSLGTSQARALIQQMVALKVLVRARRRHDRSILTIDWSQLAQLRNPRTPESRNSDIPELRNPGASIPKSRRHNSGIPDSLPHIEHPKNTHSNTQVRARVKFTPPTVADIKAYCEERGNGIDPEHFADHYAARGWKLAGGTVMKDWKAAVRTWEKYEHKFRRNGSVAAPFAGLAANARRHAADLDRDHSEFQQGDHR